MGPKGTQKEVAQPKPAWRRETAAPRAVLQTPDFRSPDAVVPVVRAKPNTMSAAVSQLRSFVSTSITESNLLGLSKEDIEGTVELVSQAKEPAEIFNWAKTLMLPESFAVEVVRMREDLSRIGRRSADDDDDDRRKGRHGKRRGAAGAKALSMSATNGLVEGKTFQCGCFATEHEFQANCVNCGRIICKQESREICYACGKDPSVLVVDGTPALQDSTDLTIAVERRNQLLQFQKERAKRMKVIDDQSGAYAARTVSGFVSAEEREAANAADEARRRAVTALHRASGAYELHQDLVTMAVDLGATPMCTAGAAASTITDDEAAARYGLQAEQATAAESGDGGSCAESAASDEKDTNDEVLRILPSEADNTLRPRYVAPSGGNDADDPPVIFRHQTSSRRVQTDYYADERATWRAARRDAERTIGNRDGALLADNDTSQAVSAAVDDRSGLADGPSSSPASTSSPPFTTSASLGDWKRLRHRDTRACLSIEQPWASLIIKGVITCIGGTAVGHFRGRLWIHAASGLTSDTAAAATAARQFAGQALPSTYPTSCILGYVVVVGIEDRAQHDTCCKHTYHGWLQSSDTTVLLCTAAAKLPLPLAHCPAGSKQQQQHIFELEHRPWLAAKSQLDG